MSENTNFQENLQDRYEKLVDRFEGDHTGILERSLKKYKDQNTMVIGTKEILKQQKELLESREKELENTKKLLDIVMQKQELTKFDCPNGRVSYRTSQSINIIDESKVAEDYKVTKEVVSIDKMKIKDDINSGKTVEGAELKKNNNLQIK